MGRTTRILAIDYGSKRVGLAMTDPLGITIQPLPHLTNTKQSNLLNDLQNLIEEKSVDRVVIGIPISLDGSIGTKALECQKFSEDIKKKCGLEVHLQDESFTSREADDILITELNLSREKRKKHRDSLAACLILKYFLESHPEYSRETC